jgi:rRNA maturation protein Nop10
MKKLASVLLVTLVFFTLMVGCAKPAPTTTAAPATSPTVAAPAPTPTTTAAPVTSPTVTAPTTTPASTTPTPTPTPTPPPTEPVTGGVYTWEEAIDHIGETATVTGPVIDSVDLLAFKAGNNIIVGIGKGALEPGAFGFELDVDRAELPADLYQGMTVSVTGKIITNPLGGATIKVTDLSQITVLGPTPPPTEPVTGGVYTWEEAIDHIGEIATVTGPIIDSLDSRGSGHGDAIDLGMGKRFGEAGYVGIALVVDRATLPADLYIDKIISVTGEVYRTPVGTAGIAVTDLSQITEIGPAPPPTEPVTGGVYTWEEAIEHTGEIATVTGPIIDVYDVGFSRYMVLGMGKKWGEPGYVGIVIKVDRDTLPEDLWVGKTISATGYIYMTPTGGVAVEITDLSQIVIN